MERDVAVAPAEPALSLAHVSKSFGGVQARSDVSFDVLPGEVHCLAGENGSGKSTLIKIITGVYQPDAGAEMRYFGKPVEALSPVVARGFGIDVIWQDLALFPQMTVAENIAFGDILGARPRFVNRRAMRDKARAVLERLGVSLDLGAPLASLSIAERQVVAICRTLVGDARLVFMDEPTASLTHTETEALLAIVRKLSADGVSIVFVSHRLQEVLDISSRVTVLRDGRKVGVYPTAGMTQSHLTELMTGKTFDNAVISADRSAAPVVLEVSGLRRAGEYEDIDLVIRAGEVVGLTGRSNRDAIAAGVAYVSEDRLTLGLVQPQSIADNVVLPVLGKIVNGIDLISTRKKSDLVSRWIRDLKVKIGRPEDAVSTLSGGNQQRIVLAKWLATEPKLLILDSPTVGVDVGARAGLFAIVRELAAEGLAILLISDEVPEVDFNADRVIHVAGGRLVASYDPAAMSLGDVEAAVYA
ncbi:MAG: sugar ABC transporter ATP-binding protein [Rhizobiales bacterium]|nr:sugar ABC transporter ATP-binding protein [Hyphomicrobiales bacterium]